MLHSACILEIVYDSRTGKPVIYKVCFFNAEGEEITTLKVKADLLDIENPRKGMSIWFTEKEK